MSKSRDMVLQATNDPSVWLNTVDNTYWFSDETERVDDNGPYKTFEEAREAVTRYAESL